MPVDLLAEAIGFGARVGAEFTFDVILRVGAGENRMAARMRGLVYTGLLLAIAAILFRLLVPTLPNSTGILLFAAALALLGGYLIWLIAGEARRLRHWGEPELTASAAGLGMPRRDRVVGWDEIRGITPQLRGRRGQVRIDVDRSSGGTIFIPTAHPEALAKTIAAERKRWETKG